MSTLSFCLLHFKRIFFVIEIWQNILSAPTKVFINFQMPFLRFNVSQYFAIPSKIYSFSLFSLLKWFKATQASNFSLLHALCTSIKKYMGISLPNCTLISYLIKLIFWILTITSLYPNCPDCFKMCIKVVYILTQANQSTYIALGFVFWVLI